MHTPDDLDATIADYAAEDPTFLDRLAAAEARLLAEGFGKAALSAPGAEESGADILLTSAEAQALLGLSSEEAVLALARAEGIRVLEPTAGEFFFDAHATRALRDRRAITAGTAA